MRIKTPCCPIRSSCARLATAIHMTGEMSTPKAGGTTDLVAFKMGSVGQATKLKGTLFKLISGYHERRIRHRNMNWIPKRIGPRAVVAGATQSGVGSAKATKGEAIVTVATLNTPLAFFGARGTMLSIGRRPEADDANTINIAIIIFAYGGGGHLTLFLDSG